MNVLTIKTIGEDNLDEGALVLNIPANLTEITFDQLVKLQNAEITNFEALSIFSGVPVDVLYNAKSYQDVTDMARIYLDLFKYSAAIDEHDKMPRKLVFKYNGKRKKIKIKKHIVITPAGAYYEANKIISDELRAHFDIYGDNNWGKFQPSLTACAAVVEAFLHCEVTGKPWSDTGRDRFAGNMIASDVLTLAKYFFNRYPNLNNPKPEKKLTVVYKTILARFKTLLCNPDTKYHADGSKSVTQKETRDRVRIRWSGLFSE